MTLRARLERLKEMGWTIDDLIAVTGEVDDALKNAEDKIIRNGVIDDILKHQMDVEIYEEISNMLLSAGITPKLTGYHYLIEAIKLGLQNSKAFTSMSTHLYPCIAKKYGGNCEHIQAGLRRVIGRLWDETSEEEKFKFFGFEPPENLTNAEFLGLICEKIGCKILAKRRNTVWKK